MANLKQLRERIKSIKSTAKLTKAMKMVAASKLTKLKKEFANNNLYNQSISNIISKFNFNQLSEPGSDKPGPLYNFFPPSKFDNEDSDALKIYFSPEETNNKILLVIFTSDKGLCGNFNVALTKKLKQDILEFQTEQKEIKIIIIGKKGYNLLCAEFEDCISDYISEINSSLSDITTKLNYIIADQIDNRGISECYLYYNFFKNSMLQIPTQKTLLPITNLENTDIVDKNEQYEYEGEDLSKNIIKLYIEGQLTFTILHSKASEEGARMTAMDNATNNAHDIVDKLTLKLNKSRQASITQELTEIIAGAESI